jgi:hypothetical protein
LTWGCSVAEYEKINLLAGERTLFAQDFTPHQILRHIKSGLVVTQDRVVFREPQHLLVFINVGHVECSTPISAISSVTTGSHLNSRRLMFAAGAGFIGLYGLTMSGFLGALSALFAVLMLAFAAFLVWSARSLASTIRNFGGGTVVVEVDSTEREAMFAAAHAINELLISGGTTPVVAPQRPAPAPPVSAPAHAAPYVQAPHRPNVPSRPVIRRGQ